jgi:ABC-type transport system involved in Fe-S cluster assembly fused permease/ATPase subunit
VLDEGKIVETGTHDHLLARSGRYAELYRFYQPDPGHPHLAVIEGQ